MFVRRLAVLFFLSGMSVLIQAQAAGYATGSPLSSRRAAVNVAEFSEKLYDVSVYTAEDAAIKTLVDAEIDLVANRWLALKIAAAYYQTPAKAPGGWDVMIAQLRQAMAPVAESHLRARAAALKRAGLEGRAPYLREYAKFIQSPNRRGNIHFADGSSANDPGTEQIFDIPEIMAFHKTSAAVKWRKLWPDLRAYGATLLGLHYRVSADPALNAAKDWDERARMLLKNTGGKVLTPSELSGLSQDRLGFTLQGLGRFLLPLGTEMSGDLPRVPATTIQTMGTAVVITRHEGGSIGFRFLDGRWYADISRRLSPRELTRVDDALTASFDQKKNRWFAPLEIDFQAYFNVSVQLRESALMREVYRSFSEQSDRAMILVWEKWQ